MSPEARACQRIDELLTAAGCHVCDFKVADLQAARGVALGEFEFAAGLDVSLREDRFLARKAASLADSSCLAGRPPAFKVRVP